MSSKSNKLAEVHCRLAFPLGRGTVIRQRLHHPTHSLFAVVLVIGLVFLCNQATAAAQYGESPITFPTPNASEVDRLLGNAPGSPANTRPQATLRQLPNSEPLVGNDFSNSHNPSSVASPQWNSNHSDPISFQLPNRLPAAPVTTPTLYSPSNESGGPPEISSARSEDLLNSPVTPLTKRSNSESSPLPSLGGKSQIFIQTIVALTVVIVLVVGAAWLFKRAAPQSLKALPTESIQVLGNAPLTAKQHLKLLRLGNRLLLLAVSDTHSQTLAEISDPDEVQHLLELTQGQNANSSQQTFRSLLSESERDRASGFLGSQQDRILKRESRPSTSTSTSPSRSSRPASVHSFEA